jgi:hypothetical protein
LGWNIEVAATQLVPESAKAPEFSEDYAAERGEMPQLRWNNDASSSADHLGIRAQDHDRTLLAHPHLISRLD